MDWLEFIGLIFTFIALIFLYIKRVFERHTNNEEEEEEGDEDEELKEFLESIQIGTEKKKEKKPPVPSPKAPQKPIAPPVKVKVTLPPEGNRIADKAYDLKSRKKADRGGKLIRQLKSPKDMIVLSEIIGKPKGF